MIQKKWTHDNWRMTLGLALGFVVALLAFEQLFLPFRVNDFLEVLPAWVAYPVSVISVALAVLLIWVGLTSGVVARGIVFFLFLLSTITEYSYVYVMGRFSIIQDYEIGLTAVNPELIGNAALSFRESFIAAIAVSAA
ncbi:MAG TPA: hypothetical protein VIO36_16170, partial [Anaerolineaceae bacterium]